MEPNMAREIIAILNEADQPKENKGARIAVNVMLKNAKKLFGREHKQDRKVTIQDVKPFFGTKWTRFDSESTGEGTKSSNQMYQQTMIFYDMEFEDEKDAGHKQVINLVSKHGKNEVVTKWAAPIDANSNPCAVYCSCMDFRFRWSWYLKKVGSLAAGRKPIPYTRKTTTRPSVNPLKVPGMCFTEDTLISLLDGTEVPIKDLVGMDHFYVYSRDLNTNRIVAGRGHSCRKTRKKSKLVRVTFIDKDGKIQSEKCTSDHKWLLTNGRYVEAQNLKEGDSLSSLYRRVQNKESEYVNVNEYDRGYEELLQPDGWVQTHIMVRDWKYGGKLNNLNTVHHSSYNSRNNDPSQLVLMNFKDHFMYHSEHCREHNEKLWTDEYRAKVSAFKTKWWENNSELKKSMHDAMVEKWDDSEYKKFMCDAIKSSCEDPERKKQMHDMMITQWEDPKWRELVISKIIKSRNTEESKQKSRDMWKDPDRAARMSANSGAILKEMWEDPYWRNLFTERSREWANSDEFKKLTKDRMTTNNPIWNPVVEKKVHDATRKAHKKLLKQGKHNFQIDHPMKKDGATKSMVTQRIIKRFTQLFSNGILPTKENYTYEKSKGVPKWENITNYFTSIKEAIQLAGDYYTDNMRVCDRKYKEDQKMVINHNVISVEYLVEAEDVYDFEVDTYHNFALSSGVFVHNCKHLYQLGLLIHKTYPNLLKNFKA
jgi:DNA gyrase subunit B